MNWQRIKLQQKLEDLVELGEMTEEEAYQELEMYDLMMEDKQYEAYVERQKDED